MVDILVKNGMILTMDSERRIIKNGSIAIEEDKIVAVGSADEIAKNYSGDVVIEAKNSLITPGFINCHCHAIQHLSRGLLLGLGATPWLGALWKYVWPNMDESDTQISTMLMALDMIKTGTTCFVDCGTHPLYAEKIASVIDQIGIRAVLGRLTADIHEPPVMLPDSMRETTNEAIKNTERFIEDWNGAAEGRISAWGQLHQVFSCTKELCEQVKRLSEKYGVGVLTHAAVHGSMDDITESRSGLRDIERLHQLGLLNSNLLAAHMGWVTDRELSLVQRNDVKVCHCPSASLFFGYGSFLKGMIPKMVEAGVTVALGSDGGNCSNFVDMVREMHLASGCPKEISLDPRVMPPETVLEMATLNGAMALLQEKKIGSLEKGKKADIVLFDLMRPEWIPVNNYNVVNNLVYSASGNSVSTVVIDGKVVMEDGKVKTVDEREILQEAQKAGVKMAEKIEESQARDKLI